MDKRRTPDTARTEKNKTLSLYNANMCPLLVGTQSQENIYYMRPKKLNLDYLDS
jgi:hypothetical protein